jgi:outer membrane protein OmpA-like peptidoglycan-associated protein
MPEASRSRTSRPAPRQLKLAWPAVGPSILAGPGQAILALQRAAGNRAVTGLLRARPFTSGFTGEAVLDAVGPARRSPGRMLEQRTRRAAELRLGAGFGDVRVHTDPVATRSALALEASAYTVGGDIYFAPGRYQPDSDRGRRLLDHELAHVLQQRRAAPADPLEVLEPAHPSEAEARGARRLTSLPRRAVQRAPSAERAWAAEHAQGEVIEEGPDHLILWNFDVDRADLKPEHLVALERFAARLPLVFLASGVALQIDGHASRSGTVQENDSISILRANVVFEYLLGRGLDGERTNIGYLGSSQPLLPNFTGAAMARNRRVDLRIVRRAPEPEPPRPIPQPPERRRPPERPQPEVELGKRLPNGSVEFKKELDPGMAIPMGPYVLWYPSGQITGKYRMKSSRGGSAVLQFGEKGSNVQFKAKLNELAEFKLDSAGSVSIGFVGKILDSEIVFDWVKAAKGKWVGYNISKSFSSPDYEWPEGSGVHWEVDVKIELKSFFGPSPAGLAKLGLSAAGTGAGAAGGEAVATGVAAFGAAEAMVIGGMLAGLAVGGLAFYESVMASERGTQRGRVFSRHMGFALRLAGEALGSYGYREAFKRLDTYRGSDNYEELYDGWVHAESLLAEESEARAVLGQLASAHGPIDLDPMISDILGRSGAFEFQPLPENLGQLAR